MSGYENVVGGKLKLKGKALDVKAGGVKKKKKINKNKLLSQDTPHDSFKDSKSFTLKFDTSKCKLSLYDSNARASGSDLGTACRKFWCAADDDTGVSTGEDTAVSTDHVEDLDDADKQGGKGDGPSHDDHLTPAERRYYEQREKIDLKRLAKTANKSHRDRIQNFNQYLANMSEHYDIPKYSYRI
ncbi:Protein FAM32A [Dillenia turbinata]|uniref:Protein FAM32A n=1 Tax=Dillenia turbinata TaxID=194707 RepID=A0AAN8Z5M5_9MAGN